MKRISILWLSAIILLATPPCFASPWNLPLKLTDQNMEVNFEVHAPWNILDGAAQQVSGTFSLAPDHNPKNLRADVAVQKLNYKAGLSLAGQLVAAWLEANPPTPAKFIIGRSTLNCSPKTLSTQTPCNGSVDGQLTIWAKNYSIDVPIEMKQVAGGYLLEGVKKIKWGEYGFGDKNSTIAKLDPVIELSFLIKMLEREK